MPIEKLVNRDLYQIESLDESASISKLVDHHNQRLSGISSDQIVELPSDELLGLLRSRTNDDFRIFIGNGLLRKLTSQEVEKLRLVQFDFE